MLKNYVCNLEIFVFTNFTYKINEQIYTKKFCISLLSNFVLLTE